MAKVLVNESSLSGIADAIRGKNGSTDTYMPNEMAAAITAIETGGGGSGFWDEDSVKNFIGNDYFTLTFPEGLTKIGKYKFYSCVLSLKDNILSLPEGITRVGASAFEFCLGFETLILPSTLSNLGSKVFSYCTTLKNVTFKSTPAGMDSLTFRNSTNLTTINVPWAEGEVANAPWGATNATINYNYTE